MDTSCCCSRNNPNRSILHPFALWLHNFYFHICKVSQNAWKNTEFIEKQNSQTWSRNAVIETVFKCCAESVRSSCNAQVFLSDFIQNLLFMILGIIYFRSVPLFQISFGQL